MRFYVLSILFVLFYSKIHGQSKLYYFLTADSTKVGVKDEYGKIIIPADFPCYGNYEENDSIAGPTIEFYIDKDRQTYTYDMYCPAIPAGAVYSRSGEFLYNPQLYDNGPDYWSEGVRRYVHNGKMGFVNRYGKKLTTADYGFVYPFNYGYAEVIKGKMKKVYEQGGEHWTVAAAEDSVSSYLVNLNGEVVKPLKKRRSIKDYYFEGNYYPYPFIYNEKEKRILNSLSRYLTGLTFLFEKSDYKKGLLQLEIIERPCDFNPYYVIKLYRDQEEIDFNSELYVEKISESVFYKNYEGDYIPIKKAILVCLEGLLVEQNINLSKRTINKARKELKRLKSHP